MVSRRIRELEGKIAELVAERSSLQETIKSLQEKLRVSKFSGAVTASISKKAGDAAQEVKMHICVCPACHRACLILAKDPKKQHFICLI
jgi:hypothetical protein